MGALLWLASCALVSDDDLAARMDLDRDGVDRPTDCDDEDATVGAVREWFVDADEDGFGGAATVSQCGGGSGLAELGGDCDDADAEVFPGAEERCNIVDDNCDGSVDEGVEPPTWYFDGDGDGYGNEATTEVGCEAPAGYVAVGGDCDDGAAGVNPDTPWFPDSDGDGWGDTLAPTASCLPPPGLIADGSDCNDADAAIHPGAQEVCDDDDTDEDCDGAADNDDASALAEDFATWYADADGDGYGDASTSTLACDAPDGFVADGRDCDDTTVASGIECAWIDVSAGYTHSCGIRGSGLVECWGSNDFGETSPPSGAFVDVAVSEKEALSCGIRADGSIACWGDTSRPGGAAPAGTYTAISLGGYVQCALATDESISCWGQDYWGTLSPPSGSFIAVEAGWYHAVALAADGTATSWGQESYGDIDLPGTDYVQVDADWLVTCGRDSAGNVDCVGDEGSQPVGSFVGPYQAVATGLRYTCLLDSAGALSCGNFYGFGGGSAPPAGATWLAVDLGMYHYCGIKTDGTLGCWGTDTHGEATPPI
jgi:hypothetical protein